MAHIFISYGNSEPLYFVQELDGLRIINGDKNEFLQIVPKALKNVFDIATIEPSAFLYEAANAFYEVIYIFFARFMLIGLKSFLFLY